MLAILIDYVVLVLGFRGMCVYIYIGYHVGKWGIYNTTNKGRPTLCESDGGKKM